MLSHFLPWPESQAISCLIKCFLFFQLTPGVCFIWESADDLGTDFFTRTFLIQITRKMDPCEFYDAPSVGMDGNDSSRSAFTRLFSGEFTDGMWTLTNGRGSPTSLRAKSFPSVNYLVSVKSACHSRPCHSPCTERVSLLRDLDHAFGVGTWRQWFSHSPCTCKASLAWAFWCVRSSDSSSKALPHSQHTCCFSPVWTFRCMLRWTFWVKAFPQYLHS